MCEVPASISVAALPSSPTAAVRRFLSMAAMVLPAFALAQSPPSANDGLQRDVSFTDYPALSSNSELIHRLLSPFAGAEIQRTLTRSQKALSEQSVDLSQEKFVTYVPPNAPAHGYALLVFVPPWQDERLPPGWATVLDKYGVIYVSAARSGNDESPLGRRYPLALIAAHNVMHRYAVNPEHVYVGGFSGGSRIAMHLALGYPDVFRGALLNAGSDPIGDRTSPLPPKELFHQFQDSTRLVYVTGANDSLHIGMDADSMRSMRKWCVFDLDDVVTPSTGHAVAGQAALSQALAALLNPSQPDPDKLAKCRAAIDAELEQELRKVESVIANGNLPQARKLLSEIDARFGGLAAPRSIELTHEPPNAEPPARGSEAL